MKTLANAETAARVRRRLESLREGDQALWGVMTAGQMICHLRGAFPMATGAMRAKPVYAGWRARAIKFVALRVPVQWPRNAATVPELLVGAAWMQPLGFDEDKDGLLKAFDGFLGFAENRNAHAFFGAMEPADWMRWGYLHTDHHLRQFGR